MQQAISETASAELFSFSPVILGVQDLNRSAEFWIKTLGLRDRGAENGALALGTATDTLILLRGGAVRPFTPGLSGLYHVAIHVTTPQAFTGMLRRLLSRGYPFSGADHTMSSSLYLQDPDGIPLELNLETPEKFGRMSHEAGGLAIVDAQGRTHQPSEPLDIRTFLDANPPSDADAYLADGAKIGHIHLAVTDLATSKAFYQSLGLEQFNDVPGMRYADLGAGSAYRHRLALNAWHGTNRPRAPADSSGLISFGLRYRDTASLSRVLNALGAEVRTDRATEVRDPSGNSLWLSV